MNVKFESPVLHQIDVARKTSQKMNISLSGNDFAPYLEDLLSELENKPQRREYTFPNEDTAFYLSLMSFFSERDLVTNKHSEQLAERLLRVEAHTEARYGHLAKNDKGLLNKGSFLQFMMESHGQLEYLGVKIEHEGYLDETDFKRRVGLGEDRKIYKACRVQFDEHGVPCNVLIFDTNQTPSTYWWSDMLELVAKNTDEANTEKAIKNIVKRIKPLQSTSPADYTLLRNASIAAFKQKGQMNFDDFVTNVFANYEPVVVGVKGQLKSITEKLRKLPAIKGFDGTFTLAPSAVPYKTRKVNASKDVSIVYDEAIQDIDKKIWSHKLASGDKVVIIRSDEAYDHFKKS